MGSCAAIGTAVRPVIYTTGKIFTDVEGLSKVGQLVRKIIDALGLILGGVSTGVKTFAGHLSSVATIAEFVEPIKRVYQLTKACNPKQGPPSWPEIVALSFAIVARCLGVVNFIHKFGIADLSGFASTVGAYVIAPLTIIGLSFEAGNHGKKLHENPAEIEAAEAALELAKVKKNYVDFNAHKFVLLGHPDRKADAEEKAEKAGADADEKQADAKVGKEMAAKIADPEHAYKVAHDRLEKASAQLVERVGEEDTRVRTIAQLLSITWDKFKSGWLTKKEQEEKKGGAAGGVALAAAAAAAGPAAAAPEPAPAAAGDPLPLPSPAALPEEMMLNTYRSTIMVKVYNDVAVWTQEASNAVVNRNKAILGVLAAITKIVFITLAFLGGVLAVGALAVSTPLMIALGLIVTGVAVVKVVYDKSHDEADMKLPEPKNKLEAAELAKERATYLDHIKDSRLHSSFVFSYA